MIFIPCILKSVKFRDGVSNQMTTTEYKVPTSEKNQNDGKYTKIKFCNELLNFL